MEGDRNYWDGWMRRRMSRRGMLRRVGLGGLALAGSSALLACGQEQAPKAAEPTKASGTTPAAVATPTPQQARPKRGGTLRIGVSKQEQPDNLDPHTYFQSWNDIYLRVSYDWLVNFNDKLEYTPSYSLAESWEAVDDVTLMFKLRKGVKFHDGTEFDAKVLKANFERIADPAVKSPRAYVIDMIKNVEYPDNYTAKVVLKEPSASFFGELAMAGLGIVSPANVAKYDIKELARRPGGSGPFVLTEMVPDDHYTYTRNKDYWQKDASGEQLPFVDTLKITPIPDDTVRLANLRTGQIDVDRNTNHKDVAKIKEDPNLQVLIQQGMGMNGMYWNLSKAPFTSLNFRLACSHAINREAIVKVVTFGISEPFTSFILPSAAWAYDPKLDVPRYDPVKAKQYADKAVADGVKMEFTTYVPSGQNTQTAQMMQADLAKIGVKMNIVPEETVTSAYRYWTSFEIDSFYAGYSMTPDPISKIIVAHHSKGMYTPEEGSTGNKNWDTPEGYYAKLDPLIDAANKTYDPKKRAQLLNQAGKIHADQAGFLGVFYTSVVMAVNKNVVGATWGGDGKGRFDRAWLKA